MEKFVRIPLKEYVELKQNEEDLCFLESCGVDNWDPGISKDEWMKENDYNPIEGKLFGHLVIDETPRFTIEEFKNYILSKDSLGDVMYFLNAENIIEANEEVEKPKYKITVRGKAKTDYPDIKRLVHVDCQDNFAEYLDDTYLREVIESGYMSFSIIAGNLWTITEYISKEELDDDNLIKLMKYTQGQWSDGIGEGFEQEPCFVDKSGVEAFISPWFHGQEADVCQDEIYK